MKLTTTDIVNLDKVIFGLTTNSCDTVPEIINGWQKFPSHNNPNDQTFRFYEGFLVDNNICSIKDGWTPNSVFGGFKALQLDTEGYKIIHHKKSVQDFIKSKEQALIPPHINITGDKNIVGHSNFVAGNIHKSDLDFLSHFANNDSNNTEAKSQYSFLKKILNWLIKHIIQIIISLVIAFIIYKFGWN